MDFSHASMCLQNNIYVCSFPFCAHKLLPSSPREQTFAFLLCPPLLQRGRSLWPMGQGSASALHTSSAATFCSYFKKQEELQNSGNVSAWRKLTCLFSCSRNYPALVNKKIVYFWWIYICWQLECHSSSTASLSLPFMWSESNFGLFLSLTAKQSCNNSKWSLEITVTLGFCSNSF